MTIVLRYIERLDFSEAFTRPARAQTAILNLRPMSIPDLKRYIMAWCEERGYILMVWWRKDNPPLEAEGGMGGGVCR